MLAVTRRGKKRQLLIARQFARRQVRCDLQVDVVLVGNVVGQLWQRIGLRVVIALVLDAGRPHHRARGLVDAFQYFPLCHRHEHA